MEARGRVFETLKGALKSRGLTYREVGERVGLSESAVKKIFSKGDCSVERLGELAQVAGLPLSELFELAERPPFVRVRLSEAQQRGLLENPSAFALYWKLSVEHMSPQQVQRLYGVEDKRLRRLLSTLDDLGLVVLEVDDRVRIVHQGMVRWTPEGPLLEVLNRDWSQRAIEDALCSGSEALFRLHELHMRPETADEFKQRLAALVDSFLRRAQYEQATTAPRDRDPVRMVLAVVSGGFVGEV